MRSGHGNGQRAEVPVKVGQRPPADNRESPVQPFVQTRQQVWQFGRDNNGVRMRSDIDERAIKIEKQRIMASAMQVWRKGKGLRTIRPILIRGSCH